MSQKSFESNYTSTMSNQSSSSNLLPAEPATPGTFSNMLGKFADIAQKGKSIASKGRDIAQKGLTASLDTFHSTAQSVGLKDKVVWVDSASTLILTGIIC